MTGRAAGLGYPMVTGVLVAGAIVAVVALTRSAPNALPALDPTPVPVAANVTEATLDYAADATLSASIGAPLELLASGLQGTVTDVAVHAGDDLQPGDVVYAVDAIPVVVYSDTAVLYRPLTVGDEGPDVAAAQRLLSNLLGVSLQADGRFGNGTQAAVRTYERRLGFKNPTGVLEPTWFTPMPQAPFHAATVDLQVGQPAPPGGIAVATGPGPVSSLSLTSGSTGPDGAYVFLAQGISVPVERAADGQWTVTNTDAAVEALATGETTGSTESVAGRVRLSEGVAGQSVPGSAVVTDRTGRTCVVLAHDHAVRTVEIVDAGVDGMARITPTLEVGSAVLLNPLQIAGDVTCPSS